MYFYRKNLYFLITQLNFKLDCSNSSNLMPDAEHTPRLLDYSQCDGRPRFSDAINRMKVTNKKFS